MSMTVEQFNYDTWAETKETTDNPYGQSVDAATKSKMEEMVEWKDNNDKMSKSLSQRISSLEDQVVNLTESNKKVKEILRDNQLLQKEKEETLSTNMANNIESSMFATLSPEEMETFKNKANEFIRKWTVPFWSGRWHEASA